MYKLERNKPGKGWPMFGFTPHIHWGPWAGKKCSYPSWPCVFALVAGHLGVGRPGHTHIRGAVSRRICRRNISFYDTVSNLCQYRQGCNEMHNRFCCSTYPRTSVQPTPRLQGLFFLEQIHMLYSSCNPPPLFLFSKTKKRIVLSAP